MCECSIYPVEEKVWQFERNSWYQKIRISAKFQRVLVQTDIFKIKSNEYFKGKENIEQGKHRKRTTNVATACCSLLLLNYT